MIVGSVEIAPLRDAVGVLGGLADLYPDVPAEAWQPYRELYPELFVGADWRISCTCYLVRTGDRTLLVDTGVGPPGLWDWSPEEEGGLLPALARHGVQPHDVDAVLITHIHVDHVGWNADARGDVVFPRARFLVHRDALSRARGRADVPYVRRCVLALADAGLIDELGGDEELADGVVAVALAGHSPGHVGLRISGGDSEALLIADAAVHPALVDQPEWRYVSDGDHDESAATRRAILAEVVDRNCLVVCGHYPGSGIGRVRSSNGTVVWEEAA